MVREINFDSILALEKQIGEHERAIIRLKRTRNSLLTVSTLLPPEILGNIFRWNVIPEGCFGGLSKGSYNFLLVCHHWFEVASHNPELWCSWGNSIQDWARRYSRCGTGPLDLALEGRPGYELDDNLRNALRDRVARDTIRQVHLRGNHVANLLNSVISSIVNKGEEIRSKSVESFIVQSNGLEEVVDVSAFFSGCHLPKLKCLRLLGYRISSWDLLKSQTTALTTLELTDTGPSPTPTLSQLLSILSSNPLLQDLTLSHGVYGDKWPSPPVPLRHLQKFHLKSGFRHAFLLLNQLELPDKMNNLNLTLDECSPLDISQTLGPYLGDRVRRRGKFPGGGLGLLANHTPSNLSFRAGGAHQRVDSAQVVWFVEVLADMSVQLEGEEAGRLGLDLIAHIPREQVIRLQTTLPILRSEKLCVEMCDLAHLQLNGVNLPTFFAGPGVYGSHASKDVLRSLDHIVITRPDLDGGDWSPLTNFLSRRAATGHQISSLRLCDHQDIDGDVAESIRGAVKLFEDDGSYEEDDYYDHEDIYGDEDIYDDADIYDDEDPYDDADIYDDGDPYDDAGIYDDEGGYEDEGGYDDEGSDGDELLVA